MINISDKVKCMASLATFQKMHKDKMSIYDVIGQLAGQIIVEKNINQIDTASLRNLVKQEAGIDVPTSIVKASMNRLPFVTLSHYDIIINENLTTALRDKILEEIQSGKEQDQQVFDSLIAFAEEQTQRTLEAGERTHLIKDFCAYIVKDSYNLKYSTIVSNFFLFKENDRGFLEQMTRIREGMIVLLGLSYNVQDEHIDVLNRPLCLYLETEVLFNMAGYNGALAKELFDEFYAQVSAINKKARKPLVKLMYFEETIVEIERYFNTAQEIVEKRIRLDMSKMAMKTIVDGCCERYDVLDKLARFKKLLKDKNIELDKQSNYYDKENERHNIDQDTIVVDVISEEYDADKILDKINLVYYIFFKRGKKSHEIFNNVGHILVSGNSLTFKVSNHKEFGQRQKDVPLVWNMERLTSRFWQMLNRGIIPSGQLKSLDLLSKSRIIISDKVNNSIERLYKQLEKKFAEGLITEDDAKIGIIEIRKNYVTADDISEGDIETYQAIIDEDSISDMIAESKARQRNKEKIIAEQNNRILEQESAITIANSIKEEAIKRLLQHENENLKRQYDSELQQYAAEKYAYVSIETQRILKRNCCIAGLYFLFCLLLFVSFKIWEFEEEYVKYIVGFVIFAIPFYRPLINHFFVAKAYAYIISQKDRKKAKEEIATDFESRNPQPKLIQKTEKDIEGELLLRPVPLIVSTK